MLTDYPELVAFLPCESPKEWVQWALENENLLLIDHAHCEKKAASTAMNLMYRYVDRENLLHKMSQLAREELLHFEQVLKIMRNRGVEYGHLEASRYASGLRQHIRTHEPAKLIDTLIIGAFVEARSCERFAVLIPHLDDEVAKFYKSLLKSEARHFEDYLSLAEEYAGEPIDERVQFFREIERQLITEPDVEFRVHSGPPKAA
ncbi:tRNA-(ms[2]io[6]A)-hydroxylase [Marinomonas fungiae]|uniref:tRNA isopentenyl-2-thiomethyl-A-37 hydroxylase MiaE (Synthesis of 2-methylthio-cis-ribozeatin) n=1 Tax=Marinomonas fungiae TaxID=1137284 RepID=A0A0K6IK86_9GAMM|nr:tRNA-(ms[2]io[6]A)-hydroxylase [Marinomonas fungiae]CUB03519.1 tRNA isopentenyl-2-thiomethyl-A-37 hydroxylase MiaE (synthesis of 2-methylthio-cis-ribozeatin) [Marinomonas fungiae]